jgi:metal-responsive CopG/Arc/MetJ family transcriptional regulator
MSLSRYEITKKYRARMIQEGFKQVSIWIQSDLLERSRTVADKEGKTLSEVISDAISQRIISRSKKMDSE